MIRLFCSCGIYQFVLTGEEVRANPRQEKSPWGRNQGSDKERFCSVRMGVLFSN